MIVANTSNGQVLQHIRMTDALDPQTLEQGDFALLDARGLLCPEPVMLLHNKIRALNSGDIIKLLASDPSTERDITRFCDFLNHPLLHWQLSDGEYVYWIKKK